MGITNEALNIISAKGINLVFGALFIFLQVVYAFYAFMVTRQVKLMNAGLKTPAASFFNTMAFIHFLASILVLFLTILFV